MSWLGGPDASCWVKKVEACRGGRSRRDREVEMRHVEVEPVQARRSRLAGESRLDWAGFGGRGRSWLGASWPARLDKALRSRPDLALAARLGLTQHGRLGGLGQSRSASIRLGVMVAGRRVLVWRSSRNRARLDGARQAGHGMASPGVTRRGSQGKAAPDGRGRRNQARQGMACSVRRGLAWRSRRYLSGLGRLRRGYAVTAIAPRRVGA